MKKKSLQIPKSYISSKEYAALCGVTSATIVNWCNNGILKDVLEIQEGTKKSYMICPLINPPRGVHKSGAKPAKDKIK